jgi:TatD DNase family protein
LFDTHAHLDAEPLLAALDGELAAAGAAGVGDWVVPGVAPAGWPQLLAAVRRVPGARAAPGVHPLAAATWNAEVAEELRRLLARPETVAVGEIGLDALLETPAAEVQERAFRAQLRLALAAGRPVLLHCRRATGRLLEILREEGAQQVGGILHAFSGSVESALAGIGLGFAIGFGGPLTYPNARRCVEVLQRIPPEWVVLETDAPDLAPHPYRGEPNRPAWLPLIAGRVAEIRGWSAAQTARLTTANARRVLKIGD